MQNVTGANGYTPLPKPGAKGPIYRSLTEMGVVLLTFVGSCDGIAINKNKIDLKFIFFFTYTERGRTAEHFTVLIMN